MPKNKQKTEVLSAVNKARLVLGQILTKRYFDYQAVHKTIWGSPAGKKKLANRLAAMLPAHKTYVEPFAGSAAVLFAKEPCQVEVLCDADKEIARAYRTIKRLSSEQISKLRSRNWKGDQATFKRLVDTQPSGDLDALYRFLYLTHFSYGKLRGKSFSPSGAGVESRTVERVEAFAPRLKNVRVYDGDYLKVVRKYDGPNTAFFLDPPYSGHNVNVGESEFDEERFFEVLKSLKGKFLLTYGIRGKLPGLLKKSDFHVQRIRTRRSIRSMRGVGGPTMLTQLVVTNYKPLEKNLISDDEWIVENDIDDLDFQDNVDKAVWSREYINNLPDEAFLYIEPDGEKDEDGKTVPRSLRHFPVRDADGKLDLPHLRNAIARIPQSKIPGLTADDLEKLQERAQRMLAEAQEKNDDHFAKSIPLIKGVDPTDERYVLGVVLEPEVVDAQGDIYSVEEVRQAAHRFMEEYGGLGLMHRFRVNDQVKVLESYLTPSDLAIGDTRVRKGTWLLAVRILDDELWERVKDGQLTGFSIGGSARRVAEAEEQNLEEPDGKGNSSSRGSSHGNQSKDAQASLRKAQSTLPDPQVSRPQNQDSINRLLDIVVEEVSLVDRAANKRRFLIVKRSDEMSTEQTADVTQTPVDEGQDLADLASDSNDEEHTSDVGNDTLEVAVNALQGLTEAVELLGSAGEGEHQDRVTELAVELRQVADRLAGTDANSADEPASPVGSNDDVNPGNNLDDLLGQVKTTIARVNAMVAESGQSQDRGDQNGSKPASADNQLATVVQELRNLTGLVKEQQQRLAKLEKRFGLPSSVPVGEVKKSVENEEVGWPLDLNRSFDRESVDKSVSFHEV